MLIFYKTYLNNSSLLAAQVFTLKVHKDMLALPHAVFVLHFRVDYQYHQEKQEFTKSLSLLWQPST